MIRANRLARAKIHAKISKTQSKKKLFSKIKLDFRQAKFVFFMLIIMSTCVEQAGIIRKWRHWNYIMTIVTSYNLYSVSSSGVYMTCAKGPCTQARYAAKISNTNVHILFSCKLNLPSFFFLSCCELRSDWTTNSL